MPSALTDPTSFAQLLFAQQDETLGSIGATVDALRAQAATMGTEMREQNSLLDLLAQDVDSTDSKLSSARRKMDRFIRDNRGASPTSSLSDDQQLMPPP